MNVAWASATATQGQYSTDQGSMIRADSAWAGLQAWEQMMAEELAKVIAPRWSPSEVTIRGMTIKSA
jgi:hypothetical protein